MESDHCRCVFCRIAYFTLQQRKISAWNPRTLSSAWKNNTTWNICHIEGLTSMQDNVLMFNFMADYVYGSDSRFCLVWLLLPRKKWDRKLASRGRWLDHVHSRDVTLESNAGLLHLRTSIMTSRNCFWITRRATLCSCVFDFMLYQIATRRHPTVFSQGRYTLEKLLCRTKHELTIR